MPPVLVPRHSEFAPGKVPLFSHKFTLELIVAQKRTSLFLESESVTIGSVPMFLGLLEPDSLVRCTDPDPSIIKQN